MRGSGSDHGVGWALELASCAAAVANYCDHVEHNEEADRRWVTDTARTLRELAIEIARQEDRDLRALYSARLRAIEHANPMWSPTEVDGGALADSAGTWRELQLAQAAHDRRYHADVAGLSRLEQLRHYSLHVAKLAGATADQARGRGERDDFCRRRLPDMLLFGLKLSTVTGERLPDDELRFGDPSLKPAG